MKALTIKQPWASLIIEGYKEYEFRSWKTNYRGRIYIHAGLGIDLDMLERFELYNLKYPSGIIGEATLVDCIEVTEEFNNELLKINPIVYRKSNYKQTYACKLIDIKKYDAPLPVKGKLGLWNYDN